MQGENLVIAGEGVGSLLCPNWVREHCSGSHLSAPLNTSRASYQGPYLPFFPMTHLLSSASLWPRRTVALWSPWGLIEPFWVPTSCDPLSRLRALPGNGQLPWLPLGTQPGRAASAPLECISTLGLLGTALLFSKTTTPSPKYPTRLPPCLDLGS